MRIDDLKLKEWFIIKFKLHRLGIGKQVLYLILSFSLLTLFIAGGVALLGMFDVKSSAIRIGNEIGDTAAENSSKALKEVSLASLQVICSRRFNFRNFFCQVRA